MQFKSIRSFIGAKEFATSQQFYLDLGFQEIPLGEKMSYFEIAGKLGFYLQKYYVKDWVDNSMLFLEVDNLVEYHEQLKAKKLLEKYPNVKLSDIVENDWGNEFFLHDPSGILWHVGNFK